MDNFNIVYIVVKTILVLFCLFYIVFPDKFPSRKKSLGHTKIRIILGLCIAFTGLSIFQKTEDSHEEKIKRALELKIARFPEEMRNDPIVLECKKFNSANMRALNPSISEEAINLGAHASCACILDSAKGMPEYSKFMEEYSSSKDIGKALQVFENSPGFFDKVKHCSEA